MILIKICHLILAKILGVRYYSQFTHKEAALRIWNKLSTFMNPVSGRNGIWPHNYLILLFKMFLLYYENIKDA